ncbi:uncharacterized protein PgNI_09303 [Pyricularia grisea]|uniref:Glycoside hydrolase 131 catalytic N-terminal domain-containing protein n=1 Tax=Pyricularia grisea TaxID=148305 RepID=A0A6P8ASQ9_PYRGI|nr:uncharacterized protein PgNI_09303 [Pyricularia grisea]TLD05161.1 hypothetical protein PgNI_09303 [Pyricularia grisea]
MPLAPLFSVLLLAAAASATPLAVRAADPTGTIQCPIVFDGRVPTTLVSTDLDDATRSPFNTGYVKGEGLKWSDIIKFPTEVGQPRFENSSSHKPITVTLSDRSIFQTQRGFRRAGLQFKDDANTGGRGAVGVRTLHWSVKIDPARGLNLSHEYLNVWHETADYSANQFNFEMGSILGQPDLPSDTFKILDRRNQQIWSTPIDETAWNNFAVTIDYDKNTLRIYYSKNDEPLKAASCTASPNDNSGEGQYQLGLLKKPTGTDDVVNSGYQASGIDEGLIYGGIFLEDSADGCVSL